MLELTGGDLGLPTFPPACGGGPQRVPDSSSGLRAYAPACLLKEQRGFGMQFLPCRVPEAHLWMGNRSGLGFKSSG